MQIKLPTIIQSIIFCLLALALPAAHAYAAPSYQFDKSTVTVATNGTFQLGITINAETNKVVLGDAVVTFSTSDLQVVSVSGGGYFKNFTAPISGGQIEMHGSTTGPNDTVTGSGTFATITFKALKASGTSTVKFTCTGGTTDTDILTTTQNILSCSSLNTSTITFSGTSNNSGGDANSSADPVNDNKGGSNTSPTCNSLTVNPSSGTSPLNVTLSCSGTDTDGKILGANFNFGDGTSQNVQKDVGSPERNPRHTHTEPSVQ